MIRLISFEGGDGSGKTTQVGLLERYLTERETKCVSTREPGGTELGKMMRRVLLEVRKEKIAPATELFLYLADRAQHVQDVIQPSLAGGALVLCDRFTDSTLAYQGYGRGVDLGVLRLLNRIASRGIVPDITFLFDCPVEMGLSRTKKRSPSRVADRFERERVEFHERVRQGFLELARAEPERILVLDASRPAAEIHTEIRKIVDQKLATQHNAK